MRTHNMPDDIVICEDCGKVKEENYWCSYCIRYVEATYDLTCPCCGVDLLELNCDCE